MVARQQGAAHIERPEDEGAPEHGGQEEGAVGVEGAQERDHNDVIGEQGHADHVPGETLVRARVQDKLLPEGIASHQQGLPRHVQLVEVVGRNPAGERDRPGEALHVSFPAPKHLEFPAARDAPGLGPRHAARRERALARDLAGFCGYPVLVLHGEPPLGGLDFMPQAPHFGGRVGRHLPHRSQLICVSGLRAPSGMHWHIGRFGRCSSRSDSCSHVKPHGNRPLLVRQRLLRWASIGAGICPGLESGILYTKVLQLRNHAIM
mmetsp:Transcript_15665/g.45839  ORF Transcript_15665/g.45839 Transcript_15665/m.45839 type:complete len:263 (-) Transcript_15665:66-854(-)